MTKFKQKRKGCNFRKLKMFIHKSSDAKKWCQFANTT